MDTAHAKTHAELEERLRFETLIADLSSQFVNVPPGRVDQEITDAQRRICEFLALDFSALWQGANEAPGYFTLTHYYSAQEGPQPPGRMCQDQYPWAREQLLAGRVIRVASLEDLPAEAARDRETLRQFGIKSNLALPLAVGGEPPVGFLGLGTTQAKRDWPDALVNRLRLLAQIFANVLARKRADQALRESELRVSLAADSAGAGLWVLDCATHVFWASEKARMVFGYSPEEVINLDRFQASVHPGDWELVRRSLDRSVQTGEPVDVEYRIRVGDGRERWISSHGRSSFTSTGEPERILGLSMDVTERRRTEERARQLSFVVEQSPVSVVVTDLEGRITYVNRKFSELSGYSFAESLGQNPRILKSGDRPAATYQALWSCITSGGTWRGKFHNRKKGGELYWEWAVIAPLLDASGKVSHFVGVKEDITERERMEAALRTSEAQLAAGTELAGLGYHEVDYAERTCFLDDRFQEICGIPPDVQQGLDPVQFWLEHVQPEDRQRLLEERQELHAGTVDRIELEYRYGHPTKGQRWLHHSARIARRSADGAGIRTFGVVRDITLQKQAQMEAQELRHNLAHSGRVTLLGQLASALAHELSQPLGAILRNAEAAEILLQEPSPDLEELRAIVTDIRQDDQRAGQVIDRLRSLLKRRSLDLRLTDLHDVITGVLSMVRTDAVARQVKLAYLPAPEPPLVLGDRIHLQQVLLNLLINALDALADGGAHPPCIQVSARRTDPGLVEVRVCDNGPGIPGASVERLFEPFFTTKAAGMGLGLPVSRTIIEAHRGKIWAENRPEGGACFCFTVPAAGAVDHG